MTPELVRLARGWTACGDGWAVVAETKEDALARFREAERRHAEIMARPEPPSASS